VFSSQITESSGLAWTDGKLWTHNDSGNPSYIFSIDTANGNILQTVVIDNFPNVDWEDITADNNYIYVGDHGNNNGTRTDLKILKIAKADITSGSLVHVNAQAISFSYTDQTSFASSSSHNFDCEALISIRDSLYIFTKDRGDLKTRVYKMPKTPGTYALTPYTSFNVNGLITGADYNVATNEIVLIGYFSGHSNSFLWFLNNFNNDMFFSGNKRRIEIGNGTEWQTEGVCYVSGDRFFISCETAGSIFASLFACNKLLNTTLAIKDKKTLSNNIYSNPATNSIYVHHLESTATYEIVNMMGQTLLKGNLDAGENSISCSGLPCGVYAINVRSQSGERALVRFEKR
jgi:hypothetical protein